MPLFKTSNRVCPDMFTIPCPHPARKWVGYHNYFCHRQFNDWRCGNELHWDWVSANTRVATAIRPWSDPILGISNDERIGRKLASFLAVVRFALPEHGDTKI